MGPHPRGMLVVRGRRPSGLWHDLPARCGDPVTYGRWLGDACFGVLLDRKWISVKRPHSLALDSIGAEPWLLTTLRGGMYLASPATSGHGCYPVHHPKCVRPQDSSSLRESESSAPIPMPSPVLCSKRNIILGWRIALRARASLVRSVGLGLWLDSRPKVGRIRKSSEQSARCRSVGNTSNSRLSRRGSLKCLCPFSSGAISIGLNCPDCFPTSPDRVASL